MKHIVTKRDLKTFLKENKVLIKYTKDCRGYKNGAIVAIGTDQIGFSKVHGDDRQVATSVKQVPYFQKFSQEFENSDIPAYLIELFENMQKAITSIDSAIYFAPKFDRFTALKTAINRAISEKTLVNVPYSIADDLDDMYIRAILYFK